MQSSRLEALAEIGNGILLFPYMDHVIEGRSIKAINPNINQRSHWYSDISQNYLKFEFYTEGSKRFTQRFSHSQNYRKPSIFFGLPKKVITLPTKTIMYDLVDELENHNKSYSLYSLPILRKDLMYLSDPEKWDKLVMVGYRTTLALLIKVESEVEIYLLSASRGYEFIKNNF